MPRNSHGHLPIQGFACCHEGPWYSLTCQIKRSLTLPDAAPPSTRISFDRLLRDFFM